MTIHQDARVYATLLDGDESATLRLRRPARLRARRARRGRGQRHGIGAGDAASSKTRRGHAAEGSGAEVLVFDLPERLA